MQGRIVWDTATAPDGDLWVAASDRVVRLPADGGEPVNYPGYQNALGVAITEDGTVYISDEYADAVLVQPEDGTARSALASFDGPTQISLDSDENILVPSFSSGTVSRVTPAGVVETVASGLVSPVDAVEASDGSIVVSEQNTGDVKRIPADGGEPVVLANIGSGAFGLELGADDTIYANNYGQGVLRSIPAEGGEPTVLLTGLQVPFGLATTGPATPQVIAFTSTAPTDATVGDDYEPTATGGASGSPVTFSTTTPDVCSYDDVTGLVSFDAAGTCTVAADQAGGTVDDVTYAPADQVTQDIVVEVPELFISASIEPNNAQPINKAGWYSQGSVTVKYTCGGGTGELECPAPVTRRNTAPGFELVRTVTDSTGETATATTPLQVDSRGPVVTIRRNGTAPYARTARPIRCTATDGRSGMEDNNCEVFYSPVVRGPNGGARRFWTVYESDIAGNFTMRDNSFVVTGKAPARAARAGSIG